MAKIKSKTKIKFQKARRQTQSKRKKLTIIAAALLSAGIILSIAGIFLVPVRTQEIEIYLAVADYTGFNIDTSALFFGTVVPGSEAARPLEIVNNMEIPVRVEFHVTGELSNITFVSENNFVIEPEVNKTVIVGAVVPFDMQYGNYTGKLKILYFSR